MMPPARPATAPGVIARHVAGETVLVPTQKNVAQFDRIFVLSRVGAFLWPLLDGTRDCEQLCELLRERYEVARDIDIARDVDAFLTELERRGLLAP
jgi:hypothetical protein